MAKEKDKIRITIELTPELHDKFQQSSIRKLANTDSEAIRACIIFAIDTTSQDKKDGAI